MVDMKRMMGSALQQAPRQQAPQQKKRGVGDFLADFVINYGAASGNPLAGSIIQNRARDQRLAAQQQAQERLYERKRTDGMEDFKLKEKYKAENSPGTELQRNYEYLKSIDPQKADRFLERRSELPPVVGPDGRLYPRTVPNRPTAPVGKITPIEGGSPQGQVVTRQQYMAAVQAMGKEKTDAWLARNNIKVGQ